MPSYNRRATTPPTTTSMLLPRIWTGDAPLPQYLTGAVELVALLGELQPPVGLAQKVEVEVEAQPEPPDGGGGGMLVGGGPQPELDEQVGLGMAPL